MASKLRRSTSRVTWFDERLGESLAWSDYTKNTFIEFGALEERLALRRQRSAPAIAVVPLRSLRHAAIEEAALLRDEYSAALTAMYWTARQKLECRGRSSRRMRAPRGGRSSGGESGSRSSRSSGRSGRWSSGCSSGRSGRRGADRAAGWAGGGRAATERCPVPRGTPARLAPQALSSASSSDGSRAGAAAWRWPAEAAAGRASQRGTPAKLEARSLSRATSREEEEGPGTGGPVEGLQVKPEARAGAQDHCEDLLEPFKRQASGESGDVGAAQTEVTDAQSSAAPNEQFDAKQMAPDDQFDSWQPGDDTAAVEGSSRSPAAAGAAVQYSVNVSNRFTALQALLCASVDECHGSEDEDPEAEVRADPAERPASWQAKPAAADSQRGSATSTEQPAAGGPCQPPKRERRSKPSHPSSRRKPPSEPPCPQLQPPAEAGAEASAEAPANLGTDAAADVLRHVQGQLSRGLGEAGQPGHGLEPAQAERLALFTARLHERAVVGHARGAAARRLVLATPVEPCDGGGQDVLQLQLGAVICCEAVDAAGWAFGTVLAPRTLAGRRGCFRCAGMRPVVAEVQRLRSGAEHVEFVPGSWEEVARAQPGTQQHRLRQKALLGRLRVARAAWEASSAALWACGVAEGPPPAAESAGLPP